MAVHIWGRLSSLNVRKVVWAAQETGVSFTRSDAGLAYGVVKTPEYLAMNPNALVPTLQDGELMLWESNVIVRYLCARYGAPTLGTNVSSLPPEGASPGLGRPSAAAGAPTLYPADLAARFDAERWMDWQQTTLNRDSGGAFAQWFRTPADKRDAGVIARSTATTEPAMAQLNDHLATRAYVGGAHFSMADIPVACDVHRWFGLPQPRPAWPHLERWFDSILSRPATRGVLDLPLS